MLQNKIQQPVSSRRFGLAMGDFRPRRFQQLSILNSGRTRRFAGAAAEAAIDVFFERRRVDRKALLFHGPHQIDAPAWAVILVAGGDVSWTSFKTKTAMNAGENLFFFAREN